ncbi:type II toxin-antitoxin system RelE/ParE family toxin [Hymenobacter lapidiphilus]|uniref:Type II toxin-antitoxin system RelE/ParE family toxin n=1 Tax=Hymenobacter lapidiphilus TaxID=2608003 RepID=A0A7Y7U4J6_9BACT|nr:type II toxin-antitoxin system RelE/ParE family toxin [Hymenobacter lapidiphilus]NVO29759.1 type II toxin-antitoxin system RelE/ParE family toxin [Hymenobacter lapidiphilus]
MPKKRSLFFFKNYFRDFYQAQTEKVKKKILWTLRVVEDLEQLPETYFKHLTGSDGLYEIRVQVGSDIFRIFCFFDKGNVVVIGHGFTKKTQKTPKSELERAHTIKAEYYESR